MWLSVTRNVEQHFSAMLHYLGLCIRRRNDVTNYLARSLGQRGFTLHKEQVFKMANDSKLKPNLELYGVDQILVIYAQIVDDQFP